MNKIIELVDKCEKDVEKEFKKAIEMGYKFMRLNYNDIHDTYIIERIKKWLNL